jgi:predicted AlkP superfamily phosphohydrolase/phosphomutase
VPGLVSVEGISRFYFKQAHPRFELYVSPVNLDPRNPALPLSTPAGYSKELAEEIGGPFYTQGIAEDTKALSAGVFNDAEYLQQSREVLNEHRRIFDKEFPKFKNGLFFFYFSSLDLNAHMLWRAMDEHHPNHTPESAAYAGAIEQFYTQMDQVLGEVWPKVDEHTTLLVLSDHGFAPFYRSFNLNTWLLQNGYLKLKDGADPEQGEYFTNVDWAHTRAYGLGLNGLYLNLRGREKDGIVAPGAEAEALLKELTEKLLTVRDSGHTVITRVDSAEQAYSGVHTALAPDLIVGYNRGYRAGWKTVLGAFTRDVLEDNLNPWSGDHCMDYTLVPGVVLSNRPMAAAAPALTDIAPTILAEFGIAKPQSMIGHSIFPAAAIRSQNQHVRSQSQN